MDVTLDLLKQNESNFIFKEKAGVWRVKFKTKERFYSDRMYFKTKKIAKKWIKTWCNNHEKDNFMEYPELKECGKYKTKTPEGYTNEYPVYKESK